MSKQVQPPNELKHRAPLAVFVEKIGDKRADVHGDISKETLRELLMSSLMLVPRHDDRGDIDFARVDSTIRTISELDMHSKDVKDTIRTLSHIYGRRGKHISAAEKFTSDIRSRVRRSLREKSAQLSGEEGRRRILGADYDGQYPETAYYDDQILTVDGSEKGESQEIESLLTLSSRTDEVDLSFDGKWLRKYLKVPLKLAIKEIVAKKPYDPVGYLGFWLLEYKNIQERNTRQLEKDNELDHLRSLMEKPIFKDVTEEHVSVDKDDEEEEEGTRDWNFKYYDTEDIAA